MSVPIESPDIRGVYLKDRAGIRAYQVNGNLPERIQMIRRKLAEKWGSMSAGQKPPYPAPLPPLPTPVPPK